MAAFSIRIEGFPARFNPDNQHAGPGDVISWNNTSTDRPHQVWEQVLESGDGGPTLVLARVPLGGDRWDPIAPRDTSSAWTVPDLPAGTVIEYRCMLHDGETAKITIS